VADSLKRLRRIVSIVGQTTTNNSQIAAGAKNASETACARIHERCAPAGLFTLIALALTAPQS